MRMKFLFSLYFFVVILSCQNSDPWRPLFNGRDLDGWKHIGEGRFTIQNRMLVTEGGMGLLWFEKQPFSDCRIRVVYKTEHIQSNSGVFIRIPHPPADPWDAVHGGYEVQIDDSEDDFHCTGTLYSLTRTSARPGRPGEWNTMIIELDGTVTRVWINDVLVTDFTEGDPVPPERETWEPERGRRPYAGFIGIQNHQPEDVVIFKEISVLPLR